MDHNLFLSLLEEIPEVAEIRMDMKRGAHHSEFSMFRYDVYFWRTDPDNPRPQESQTYDLKVYNPEQHSLAQLWQALSSSGAPEMLALARIPDARTAADGHLVRLLRCEDSRPTTCGKLRQMVAALTAAQTPLEPEALYRLGVEAGYDVEMMWSPQVCTLCCTCLSACILYDTIAKLTPEIFLGATGPGSHYVCCGF